MLEDRVDLAKLESLSVTHNGYAIG